MNTIFLAALASAALAAPTDPQALSVGYTQAPVAVTACAVESQTLQVAGWSTGTLSLPGDIRISFVNAANTKATSVEFAVHSGNALETVTETGTFSTGVAISHEFS